MALKETAYLKSVLVLSIASISFCTDPEISDEFNIPDSVKNLENLTLISFNPLSTDSVLLVEDQIYESNESIFIEGYIWDFEVDNKNNVHILSSGPGVVGIYSIDAKGNYLGKMGSFGRGPGEFESISSIHVVDDKLVALDPRLRRFSVFSLTSFDLLCDEIINTEQVKKDDAFSTLMRARKIYGQYQNEFVISFWASNFYDLNQFTDKRFYLVSPSGIVQKDSLIEIEKYSYYNATGFEQNGRNSIGPFTASFTRSSRIAFSDKGILYRVWTENFLIEKYSIDKGYIGSYYFPFKNSKLLLSDTDLSDRRKEKVIDEGKPETWPAVYTLELDDKEQLWVATITESDSTFKWFVLNEDGEVKAAFTTVGKKKKNFIGKKPLIKITDGFLYMHERDYEKGIDRIVKYKIVFKKRE